ncbi:MAG: capsid cement protein [Candidatus Kapaibacteriota bacterium]
MAIPNKAFQPTLTLTIRTTMELPAFRFVDFTGKLCQANKKALGVSMGKWSNGALAGVVVLGTAIVEASVPINAGDKVASDNDGKAKVVTSNEEVNGRALSSANAGEFVRILIVP